MQTNHPICAGDSIDVVSLDAGPDEPSARQSDLDVAHDAARESRARRRKLQVLSRRGRIALVGQIPVESEAELLQMICTEQCPQPGSYAIRELSASDGPTILWLTAIAFPGFFRLHTHEMGKYVDIHADGSLIAMAGERMASGSFQEANCVCSHPDFLGRSHATALVALVASEALARGLTRYPQVVAANQRAIAVHGRPGITE